MKKSKKWIALVMVLVMTGAMTLIALTTDDLMFRQEKLETSAEGEVIDMQAGEIIRDDVNTLILWYTDDALTEYLTSEALLFQADHNVRIKPILVSGVELLKQINTASIYDGEEHDGETYAAPDMYITSHDNLMKAYYAGLASEITDDHNMIGDLYYSDTSLHAVSCDEKYVAYPFYYETNYLLYNKTYMANIAKDRMDTESDAKEGQAAQEAIDSGEDKPEDTEKPENSDANNAAESEDNSSNGDADAADASDGDGEVPVDDEEGTPMGEENVESDPDVLERLATIIPSTIDDIKTFANNYDAPEQVEAVFKWDVSDIFYNYFFVGNYMDVGGADGDDNSVFNIYNQQTIDCLSVYQNLNQFFSIDSKEVTYEGVLDEFLDGKIVFTVATTDAIRMIEEAKAAGNFDYEYGVAVLPDISSTLKARGLSVTNAVVINGYSDKKQDANDFAKYLVYDKADDLYAKSGKVACRRNIEYSNPEINKIMDEYDKSMPLPKMIEASNFWVQLEIAFTEVWNGADPDATLKELSDTIGEQIEEIEYHTPLQESISVGVD